MIKKGIILAGGYGTRMSPLTKAINKQLLPIYDKPLFYYPLSVFLLSGIKDILIIVAKGQLENFKKVLPNGKNLGIKIQYLEQDKPNGLPEAFILGEKFISNKPVALILGDNFFYGQSLTGKIKECLKLNKGAKIFLHPVNNPSSFGVVKLKNNRIVKILEKPKKFISNLAITGLYFFDKNVVNFSKKLVPSKRKELEIIDLLKIYKIKNKLSFEMLGRGGTWLDTGSIDDFISTSNFVQTIEKRQGFKIGCLEEISYKNKWINKKQVIQNIKFYGKCLYSEYLQYLINNKK